MTMNDSARAFALLKARSEHVCFAESLTGGLIAATFIENPGASCAVNESYVTYAPGRQRCAFWALRAKR